MIEYAEGGELITWDENKATFYVKNENGKLTKEFLKEEAIR